MPEEIEDIAKAKADAEAAKKEAETAKAETAAMAKDRDAKEKELEKLRKKDFDYGRLRKKVDDMTEDERNALTEKEIELQRRAEELEDKTTSFQKAVKSEWKKNAIERLSRGNADRAKEIEAAMSDVVGSDADRESVEAHVMKAAKLVSKSNEFDHVSGAFNSMSGAPPEPAPKKTERTEGGSVLAKMMGIKDN